MKVPAESIVLPRRKTRIKSSRLSSKRQRYESLEISNSTQGVDVKKFCRSYQVSQDTFTRLTGFSPRAVAHWVSGKKPSESTARRLTEVHRIFQSLEALIPPESIGPWLKLPNPAFDGSTPLQVIERGETDRIWRMIYELESGEPG